jgi:transcriptional regulator with XRE-family HTH domain
MPKQEGMPPTLVDRIREAIRDSGMGIRELGRASGIHPSRISRFMRQESSIDVAAVSAICQVLGYELVKTRPSGSIGRASGDNETPASTE